MAYFSNLMSVPDLMSTMLIRQFASCDKRSRRLPSLFALLLVLWSTMLVSSGVHATARETIINLDDGSSVKVFLFEPDNHGTGPWPLSILMAGGGGNEYVARAQFWLGQELANQGWLIAVPVSTGNLTFTGSGGHRIPEVIRHLQVHDRIRGNKALLMGVSTGGSTALELAAEQPDLYYGVVATPGMLKDLSLIGNMNQLPVYLRIGEQDSFRWNRSMPALVDALEAAGARVNARLVDNGKHIFRMNWDDLRPWLDALPIERDPRP